jgi:hypothetical protein
MNDSVIVGLFTLGGVLGTALINIWQRSQDRKAEAQRRKEDRQERERERLAAEMALIRSEGASILARAQSFLTEAHPHRLGFNVNIENWTGHALHLTETWEALRDPIGTLAVRLPTEDGRDLAEAFSVALHNVWQRGTWLLSMMARHEDYKEWLKGSMEWWEKASNLSKRLREALHEAG